MNFADSIMTARRKAALTGRGLTNNEAAGIASGYANSATSRLSTAKSMRLAEEAAETSKQQFAKQLEFARYQDEGQRDAADDARSAETTNTIIGGGLALGMKAFDKPIQEAGSVVAEKTVDAVKWAFGW